jgi:hypothetical protein
MFFLTVVLIPFSLLRLKFSLTCKLSIFGWRPCWKKRRLLKLANNISMAQIYMWIRSNALYIKYYTYLIIYLGADYMEHFQPRGWTQPCLPGWNFSHVCNTKLYQSQTRDYMTKFSTQGWNYYELFEHAWQWLFITRKQNECFFTSGNRCRELIL